MFFRAYKMHKVSFLSLGRDVSKIVTKSSFKKHTSQENFLSRMILPPQNNASEEILRKHVTSVTFIL